MSAAMSGSPQISPTPAPGCGSVTLLVGQPTSGM
jgi:hypothetical protein